VAPAVGASRPRTLVPLRWRSTPAQHQIACCGAGCRPNFGAPADAAAVLSRRFGQRSTPPKPLLARQPPTGTAMRS